MIDAATILGLSALCLAFYAGTRWEATQWARGYRVYKGCLFETFPTGPGGSVEELPGDKHVH